jgi:hypothetical protein
MHQRAGRTAIFAEVAQRARDNIVSETTAGDWLRRAAGGISRGRQAIGQHDKEIEIAVRFGIPARAAAELPNGERLESEYKPVTQEREGRGFVLERADRSRLCVVEQLADGRFASLAQEIGNRLKNIPMFGTCADGLDRECHGLPVRNTVTIET